jgi:hypothetical protein
MWEMEIAPNPCRARPTLARVPGRNRAGGAGSRTTRVGVTSVSDADYTAAVAGR